MKLLTKTTLYFFLAMIPLLTAASYLLYRQFSKHINERADRELLYEEEQWIQYLRDVTARGTSFILRSPDLLISPSDRTPTVHPSISDRQSINAEDIQVPVRELQHVVNIYGNKYHIIIRKSQEQKLALINNITSTMLIVLAGLLAATLIFNWFISKKLWLPFRNSLYKVSHLELTKMKNTHFEESNIQEFDELNKALNAMTQKIHNDYINMKEFIEDAAHEMQTPLAVAHAKLELLLQDNTRDESQTEAVVQSIIALDRLNKLNQSLLLLSKIENNQFKAQTTVSLTDTTRKYLHLFDEIIKAKQISVHTDFADEFAIKLHPFLADTLISNLLGNALKYNLEGGKIIIVVSPDEYCIENTSDYPAIDSKHLFTRFNRGNFSSEESVGMGLAIVKKIVDNHNLHITYYSEGGVHRFCISKS